MATYNRIELHHEGELLEGEAFAAVTPGHLVEQRSDGKYQKHSVADGASEFIFAIEDSLIGKSIDDDYAADDRMRMIKGKRGMEFLAWLKDGQNVAVGAHLASNGDGTFRAVGVGVNPLAVAQEALDLSAAGADGRIVIRIL